MDQAPAVRPLKRVSAMWPCSGPPIATGGSQGLQEDIRPSGCAGRPAHHIDRRLGNSRQEPGVVANVPPDLPGAGVNYMKKYGSNPEVVKDFNQKFMNGRLVAAWT